MKGVGRLLDFVWMYMFFVHFIGWNGGGMRLDILKR